MPEAVIDASMNIDCECSLAGNFQRWDRNYRSLRCYTAYGFFYVLYQPVGTNDGLFCFAQRSTHADNTAIRQGACSRSTEKVIRLPKLDMMCSLVCCAYSLDVWSNNFQIV